MGDVIKFQRPKLSEKFKGKSLCREGFHKWKVQTEKRFEVKQGRLVTVYRCERCGEQKTVAH